jgi:starch synthase
LNILIACSEAVPYAKTGGLADVTGALVREFRKHRQNATLIMPLYSVIKERFRLVNTGRTVTVPMGRVSVRGVIWTTGKGTLPEAYFIECAPFFSRPELYGTAAGGDYKDNALRYIFFSRAVLEACLALNIRPDVIHCNDWQTGLVPLYLKNLYRHHEQFKNTASLLTIHNLGYQGNFDAGAMAYTGLGRDFFVPERIEFFGKVNFLKAGLLNADLLNTVSDTYAREILDPEHGFGLDGVLRLRQDDLYGIVNGMDITEWDPSHDPLLPSGYSFKELKGKQACKTFFHKTVGLRDRKMPLLGVVSRLSYQKGVDLVLQAADDLVALGVNIAVLGKGDEVYHAAFLRKAEQHAGNLQVTIGFEEGLAHRLYAAADFFLMPSQYEPCGIGQLIAMRYGTVPIARRTGGLADTIDDYDHLRKKGTGFLFQDFTPAALLNGVKRALCVYDDARKMRGLIGSAMNKDFSWKPSAEKYLGLYRKAKGKAFA